MARLGDLPTCDDFLWPVIDVLRGAGGCLGLADMTARIATSTGSAPGALLSQRLAEARFRLRELGLIEHTARGVWRLTAAGSEARADLVDALVRLGRTRTARRGRIVSTLPAPQGPCPAPLGAAAPWMEDLILQLQGLSASAFERLCQAVLSQAGFSRVEVTGRSGDGGVDGVGVLRLSLLSFHVLFQCKRWTNPVGAPAVRDFRGAMCGRADKGLIITTSDFTLDARREAVRHGAPPIELINGAALCELLKAHRLGVSVRMVEEVSVDTAAFASLA